MLIKWDNDSDYETVIHIAKKEHNAQRLKSHMTNIVDIFQIHLEKVNRSRDEFECAMID